MSIHNKYSQFVNSPIVVGKDNSVIIQNIDAGINWEMIQDELIEISSKLPKTSEEYVVCKNALSYAMSKDKNGLMDCIRKNLTSFTSDIFKDVAGGMLVELIKLLVL